MRRAMTMAFALATGLAAFAAEAADGVDDKLGTVERALEAGRDKERALEAKTETIEQQIIALRAELVTAARAVQNSEEALTTLEVRLAALTREESAAAATLGRRRVELIATLGAFERLALLPPEAVIATPVALADTVRTSRLLRAAVLALEGRADLLAAELIALAGLRAKIGAERDRVALTRGALAAKQKRVDALLTRKSALRGRTLEAQHAQEARVAGLAAEATDLRELMAKLAAAAATAPPPPQSKPAVEAPPPAPETAMAAAVPPAGFTAPEGTRSFTQARGTLPLPARGRLVGAYGQTDANGERAHGITIETRAGAVVVTPYDGRVAFAGPYRGYGQLLIIDHGEGYHTLLAGFSRIGVVLGQWLLAGEAVGAMGRPTDGGPKLYVELRYNGDAINPLPWLAASERKVSG